MHPPLEDFSTLNRYYDVLGDSSKGKEVMELMSMEENKKVKKSENEEVRIKENKVITIEGKNTI